MFRAPQREIENAESKPALKRQKLSSGMSEGCDWTAHSVQAILTSAKILTTMMWRWAAQIMTPIEMPIWKADAGSMQILQTSRKHRCWVSFFTASNYKVCRWFRLLVITFWPKHPEAAAGEDEGSLEIIIADSSFKPVLTANLLVSGSPYFCQTLPASHTDYRYLRIPGQPFAVLLLSG